MDELKGARMKSWQGTPLNEVIEFVKITRPDLDPEKVLSTTVGADRWAKAYRIAQKEKERSHMKTTVQELLSTIAENGAGLNRLAASPLPVKTAYWVSRLLNAARTAARDFEIERVELFKSMA